MVVDLSPLLRGAGAESIRVAGVSVGQRAAGIDRAAVTAAEGDFIRIGDIALRVKDGTVERIFVRGPSLDTLLITREADIARSFGPADGHERSFGRHVHHFSAKGLAIAWDVEGGRIDHVELGAAPWQEPRLGAPELLRELLNGFPGLSAADWAEPPGGSAKVRHQRIAALARALGLGAPGDVVHAEFLKGDLADGRRRVLDELVALVPDVELPVRSWSAPVLFTHLLHYRVDAERMIRATSGWLECSDPALLGMIATQDRIGAQVTALMSDVDRWLCTLLDPTDRTFELRELIARHGWPDVDLRQLELDEL
jgi:hypothetical protein